MSNKEFSRSIGGSYGSGAINSNSTNRSQASGSAVTGYGKPGTGRTGSAQGRTGNQGASPPMPKHGMMPAKKNDEAKGGKPKNGGRM